MDEIINYYNGYDEEIRLERDNLHRIEYITSTYFLDKVIKPGSRILDVAAGTGKYAFYFANKGFSVTARDVVPRFVECMKEKQKGSSVDMDILLGDARDLSMFEANSFDVVLCMGPYYHLKEDKDRLKVIEECLRVLKKDGVIVSAYINRYAAYMAEVKDMNDLVREKELLEDIISKGLSSREKTKAFYFSYPKEIEDLMAYNNVEKIYNIGADGIGYLLSSKIKDMNEEEYGYWLKYHIKSCESESLIGYSLHGLYIGRKK
jgi:ubiquinone/menaquinone biosynthesis C-methylase UbiE